MASKSTVLTSNASGLIQKQLAELRAALDENLQVTRATARLTVDGCMYLVVQSVEEELGRSLAALQSEDTRIVTEFLSETIARVRRLTAERCGDCRTVTFWINRFFQLQQRRRVLQSLVAAAAAA